jgi:hypothetical protein
VQPGLQAMGLSARIATHTNLECVLRYLLIYQFLGGIAPYDFATGTLVLPFR